MNKYDDLLERAKWSTLSDSEIAQVAAELQKASPEEDRYTLYQHIESAKLERIRHDLARFELVRNKSESEKYKLLRERASNHSITEQELDGLVAELQDPNRKTDPVVIMRILAELETAITLPYLLPMEPFLKGPDAWAAKEALVYLCMRYTLYTRYTKEILDLMRGAPWDWDSRARITAIAVAGGYLERQPQPMLLHELIHIAEHEENPLVRDWAFSELYALMGYKGVSPLPSDASYVANQEVRPPDILREAKQRLAREEAS